MHCGNGYRYTGRINAFVLITPVYYCLPKTEGVESRPHGTPPALTVVTFSLSPTRVSTPRFLESEFSVGLLVELPGVEPGSRDDFLYESTSQRTNAKIIESNEMCKKRG